MKPARSRVPPHVTSTDAPAVVLWSQRDFESLNPEKLRGKASGLVKESESLGQGVPLEDEMLFRAQDEIIGGAPKPEHGVSSETVV